MICNQTVRKFCCEDISQIENYNKAVTDMEHTWHCHHRLEIQNGIEISHKELKNKGLYYHRPADELIFLTHTEHNQLHFIRKPSPNKGKPMSEEQKRKISLARKAYFAKKRKMIGK